MAWCFLFSCVVDVGLEHAAVSPPHISHRAFESGIIRLSERDGGFAIGIEDVKRFRETWKFQNRWLLLIRTSGGPNCTA